MDVIEQLIEGTGKVLAKMFTGKVLKNEYLEQIQNLNPQDYFVLIEILYIQNRFCEIEDMLFSLMDINPSLELFEMGKSIIDRLSNISGQRLAESDFTKKDIEQWKNDWLKFEVNFPAE